MRLLVTAHEAASIFGSVSLIEKARAPIQLLNALVTSVSKRALRVANALKFGLPKLVSIGNIFCALSPPASPSSVSRLLSARTLKHAPFSVPPSALGRSKVSHRLRLSM